MKARLVVILCTILLTLFAFGQMSVVMAAGSEKQVPFGASIEDGELDGVLGEEWADAESFSTRIGTYRADVYMKHDGEYWYIAVTKQGRIRGGTVTLWMCFDASGDGKLYSKGDDSLMLPETDGRLVRDIDYAYTRSMKAPKKDTSVGGTNDKIGAGKFSDDTYVFEIKIEMDSGDHGSKGNDMVLAPGLEIAFVIGLMNGGDKASSKTVVAFDSEPCTCGTVPTKTPATYCRGKDTVTIEIKIYGDCPDPLDVTCDIRTYEEGVPPTIVYDEYATPSESGSVDWDQKDQEGNQVDSGQYYLICSGSCTEVGFTNFTLVECDDGEEPPDDGEEPPEDGEEPDDGEEPPQKPSEERPERIEEVEKAPTCLELPVFEDDFSNPDSGWPLYRTTEDYHFGYNLEAQEYFISVKTPDTQAWSINQPAGTFQDFCLDVDTTQVGGPNANEYGVIFAYQDDDNFYAFTISGDGYYSLTKRVNGIDTAIVAPTASPSINTGQSTNHLELVVRGSDIHLYVNTRLLTKVRHSTGQEGYLGLYAASISGGDVRIRFDDLVVRQAQ